MSVVFFWRLDRGTPDIVYNASLDVLKAIRVPQHFDDGSSAKGVACNCNLVYMKPVFPACPVYSFKTSRTSADISFFSSILPSNVRASPFVYLLEHAIGFLNLCKAKVYLRASELGVDADFVGRAGIVGVVFGEYVVLS